jgi:hypothetical protein
LQVPLQLFEVLRAIGAQLLGRGRSALLSLMLPAGNQVAERGLLVHGSTSCRPGGIVLSDPAA